MSDEPVLEQRNHVYTWRSNGCANTHAAIYWDNSKQTLALRQASEESACFLLSFFCDD